MRAARSIALLVAACVSVAHLSEAQQFQPPHLTRYITDLTGTLTDAEIASLNGELDQFDRQTSTQLVVLMVPSIGGEALENASLSVAEANGIGRKGKDNGALLFIAKDDRKARIEVGYGLEGVLPDALAGIIIRRELAPRFQHSDYAGGIGAAVRAMMLATKNEYTAEKQQQKSPAGLLFLVFILFGGMMFLRNFRGGGPGMRGRRYGGMFLPMGVGGGSSGGGFGGGSFSGGGGSFGGGGASGGW